MLLQIVSSFLCGVLLLEFLTLFDVRLCYIDFACFDVYRVRKAHQGLLVSVTRSSVRSQVRVF